MPHVRYYVFSLYLSYSKDADIIAWLEEQPRLKRGETIKRIIRTHFSERTSPTHLYSIIMADLYALNQQLAKGTCPWTSHEVAEIVGAMEAAVAKLKQYVD